MTFPIQRLEWREIAQLAVREEGIIRGDAVCAAHQRVEEVLDVTVPTREGGRASSFLDKLALATSRSIPGLAWSIIQTAHYVRVISTHQWYCPDPGMATLCVLVWAETWTHLTRQPSGLPLASALIARRETLPSINATDLEVLTNAVPFGEVPRVDDVERWLRWLRAARVDVRELQRHPSYSSLQAVWLGLLQPGDGAGPEPGESLIRIPFQEVTSSTLRAAHSRSAEVLRTWIGQQRVQFAPPSNDDIVGWMAAREMLMELLVFSDTNSFDRAVELRQLTLAYRVFEVLDSLVSSACMFLPLIGLISIVIAAVAMKFAGAIAFGAFFGLVGVGMFVALAVVIVWYLRSRNDRSEAGRQIELIRGMLSMHGRYVQEWAASYGQQRQILEITGYRGRAFDLR